MTMSVSDEEEAWRRYPDDPSLWKGSHAADRAAFLAGIAFEREHAASPDVRAEAERRFPDSLYVAYERAAYIAGREDERERMRDGWVCPHCKSKIEAGDYPDYWTDGCEAFTFDCACGAEFEVGIEWEPSFYVREDERASAPADTVPVPRAWLAELRDNLSEEVFSTERAEIDRLLDGAQP